jgi:hypothetical protein
MVRRLPSPADSEFECVLAERLRAATPRRGGTAPTRWLASFSPSEAFASPSEDEEDEKRPPLRALEAAFALGNKGPSGHTDYMVRSLESRGMQPHRRTFRARADRGAPHDVSAARALPDSENWQRAVLFGVHAH